MVGAFLRTSAPGCSAFNVWWGFRLGAYAGCLGRAQVHSARRPNRSSEGPPGLVKADTQASFYHSTCGSNRLHGGARSQGLRSVRRC